MVRVCPLKREQLDYILRDLEQKMVVLTGRRQVGKTWLSREIMGYFPGALYLNYDSYDDRRIITDRTWPGITTLLVLDEIHKMPHWKQFLKGVYDTRPKAMKILVTGSARLDTFRLGGESLAGRYYRHRLFPLTPAECYNTRTEYSIDHFMERGAFRNRFWRQIQWMP